MQREVSQASGWPGSEPGWNPISRNGLGTSLSRSGRCWFTLAGGTLSEVFYPRINELCVRHMELLVTDGAQFLSQEGADTRHEICYAADGTPAYHLANTCLQGRYRLLKQIIVDPERDVILQKVRFEPLEGDMSAYHLYAFLLPHDTGAGATAWTEDHYGMPMLLASIESAAMAFACSPGWLRRSVGFLGASDGREDLRRNRQLTREYARADNGHVGLTGEIDLSANGEFVIAIGFGMAVEDAADAARASLRDNFDALRSQYIRQWQSWQHTLRPLDTYREGLNLYRTSTMVLRTHESLLPPGGIISSLSAPWGPVRADEESPYHAVWPRDLVEAGGGLLAAGARQDIGRVLAYLEKTQRPDGHWAESVHLGGTPFRHGNPIDESALPILLVDLARREDALDSAGLEQLWPMVRRAAGYIVRNGPISDEDRWEHDRGCTPFTLASEVAGLLAAAHLAELVHQPQAASYLRQTADSWNGCIEQWLYVAGTALAQRIGVDGYYVRMVPPDFIESGAPLPGEGVNYNRRLSQSGAEEAESVSPDVLSLVRFGLRDPHDPRIVNTLQVIDAVLRIDTHSGPCWRRHQADRYGEHEDGSPFDGNGRGRAWPLLTGERGHYELAAGRRAEAERLLETMAAFANDGGMLPEQIWDAPNIAEKNLYFGRPTGSAMPLVWAHAEYIKLRRSLHDGWVFDMPLQTAQRYMGKRPAPRYSIWRFDRQFHVIPEGLTLRLELLAPGVVHFSTDDWHTTHDLETQDTGFGLHIVDLPSATLATGSRLVFSFYWPAVKRWEGRNFPIEVGPPPAGPSARDTQRVRERTNR